MRGDRSHGGQWAPRLEGLVEVVTVDFDPQLWLQFGPLAVAFGYLLWFVLTRFQRALDANTQAINSLRHQVMVNTMVLARWSGQDVAEVEKMVVANGPNQAPRTGL